MSSLPIPPIQDIARLVQPSEDATLQHLSQYYAEVGAFNYGVARKLARALYSGSISLASALAACDQKCSPLGRRSNKEVAELLCLLISGRELLCYDLAPRSFDVRSDFRIPVRAPFYFVEARRPKIFWLQPRRSYALTHQQRGLLASVLRMTYAVDDFEAADLELVDLSVPEGSKLREPRIFNFESLPLLNGQEVRDLLAKFVRAFERAQNDGMIRRERQRKDRSDERQPPLFK